jgi:hypothetical protein
MTHSSRQVFPDGTVVLRGEHASFFFKRPRPGVVEMKVVGRKVDNGELGTAPMDELAGDLGHFAPVELFVDLSEAVGAMVPIQQSWAEWFARNRTALKVVHMLVQGSYMQFTAEVVRFFSRTDNLIRVYLDKGAFDRVKR